MNTPQKHRRKLLLGDGLLVGCILLVCIALASVPHLSKKATSAFVKVSVDGKSYAVYPLEVDTTVEIGQTGVRFVIENGKAFIAASDCPDKLCMRAGALSEADTGKSLICLPNRVAVTLIPGNNDSKQSEVDGIVG